MTNQREVKGTLEINGFKLTLYDHIRPEVLITISYSSINHDNAAIVIMDKEKETILACGYSNSRNIVNVNEFYNILRTLVECYYQNSEILITRNGSGVVLIDKILSEKSPALSSRLYHKDDSITGDKPYRECYGISLTTSIVIQMMSLFNTSTFKDELPLESSKILPQIRYNSEARIYTDDKKFYNFITAYTLSKYMIKKIKSEAK